MNKEFRLQMKLKNNLLLSKIEESGFRSIGAFCLHYDLNPSSVSSLVNLSESPYMKKTGALKRTAIKLLEVLNCTEADLFTETHALVKKNKFSLEIEANQLKMLTGKVNSETMCPSLTLQKEEVFEVLHTAIESLSPRERIVIEQRTMEAKLLDDLAIQEGVSRERIRQIEAKALRKLRHPSRGVTEAIEPK